MSKSGMQHFVPRNAKESHALLGNCSRTLAIWRPGEPINGVRCSYAYNGSVPCTGRLVCSLCGKDKPL